MFATAPFANSIRAFAASTYRRLPEYQRRDSRNLTSLRDHHAPHRIVDHYVQHNIPSTTCLEGRDAVYLKYSGCNMRPQGDHGGIEPL